MVVITVEGYQNTHQIMHEQYKASKYYIDLVFPEHKLGIEIDANEHTERCKPKERERKKVIENAGFKIIKEDFDRLDGVGEIQDFIYECCKKLTKELNKKNFVELTEKINIVAKP